MQMRAMLTGERETIRHNRQMANGHIMVQVAEAIAHQLVAQRALVIFLLLLPLVPLVVDLEVVMVPPVLVITATRHIMVTRTIKHMAIIIHSMVMVTTIGTMAEVLEVLLQIGRAHV